MAKKASPKAAQTTSSKKPVKKVAAKPAAEKTVISRSVKADRPRENRNIFTARFNNELSAPSLLAEMLGTFLLVSSILITSGDAFFTGLTFAVVALGIMAISGAHVNPAVTFGLWTMRKISGMKVPFYWLAQFLGAIAAMLVMSWFGGEKLGLSLGSFLSFDGKIFAAELVGTAVFTFGLAAAINRMQTDGSKAVGVGFSLFLGLVIATGFLSQAVKGATTTAASNETPRLGKVNNVALNPAVALALKERDASSSSTLQNTAATPTTTPPSRFTIETVLGTLIGAALGGNLYMLLAARIRVTE
jgi:glycerol uptake facilitator-like aquaporin